MYGLKMFLLASSINQRNIYFLACSPFTEDLLLYFLIWENESRDSEKNPLAPTSTAKQFTLHPFWKIVEHKVAYFSNLFLWRASMFSSHGEVNSTKTTRLLRFEIKSMSGRRWITRFWSTESKDISNHQPCPKCQSPRHRRKFTTSLNEINGIIFRGQRTDLALFIPIIKQLLF